VVRFIPWTLYLRKKAPGNNSIGDWVIPRDGLDDVEKRKLLTLKELELRTHGRSARSQSLYRLRYIGSQNEGNMSFINHQDEKYY
jgi:hypothetical protein